MDECMSSMSRDSRLKDGGFGEPVRGNITLRLPPGKYKVRMLPSGATEWGQATLLQSDGKEIHLPLPEFRYDCAVMVRAH